MFDRPRSGRPKRSLSATRRNAASLTQSPANPRNTALQASKSQASVRLKTAQTKEQTPKPPAEVPER